MVDRARPLELTVFAWTVIAAAGLSFFGRLNYSSSEGRYLDYERHQKWYDSMPSPEDQIIRPAFVSVTLSRRWVTPTLLRGQLAIVPTASGLLSLLLLASAIGMLDGRNWGRRMFLTSAIAWIVLGLTVTFVTVDLVAILFFTSGCMLFARHRVRTYFDGSPSPEKTQATFG